MAAATPPCPIPQPPGSANGTAFGPNQPLPFPDRSLDQLTGIHRLDGEIVVQLAGTQCLSGLSEADLLSRLQSAYPESAWNMALLSARLTAGRRQGRFCQAGNSLWVLRNDMVHVNAANQIFQGLVPSIDRVPICQTTVSGVVSGAYRGDLPLCGQSTCGVPQVLSLIPPSRRNAFDNAIGTFGGGSGRF